ncbi:Uncharacterized protein TCM_024654 [Theobroma cacao]|uniref:Uncharacterized protein n=1 Tax=Theobroma cacao TaxID=3641 RepID=A0A061EXX1_THECC|nr:Uncharacterized protein TCM_024654 [Theobroma cacao]
MVITGGKKQNPFKGKMWEIKGLVSPVKLQSFHWIKVVEEGKDNIEEEIWYRAVVLALSTFFKFTGSCINVIGFVNQGFVY